MDAFGGAVNAGEGNSDIALAHPIIALAVEPYIRRVFQRAISPQALGSASLVKGLVEPDAIFGAGIDMIGDVTGGPALRSIGHPDRPPVTGLTLFLTQRGA